MERNTPQGPQADLPLLAKLQLSRESCAAGQWCLYLPSLRVLAAPRLEVPMNLHSPDSPLHTRSRGLVDACSVCSLSWAPGRKCGGEQVVKLQPSP